MTNAGVNDEPQSTIRRLVLRFVEEMNEWERGFYDEWRPHLDSFDNAWTEELRNPHNARTSEIERKHGGIYREIFERSCTIKRRAYGGPDGPLSAGIPTKYEGVDEQALTSVDLKTSSRAEVFFQAKGEVVNYKFVFVVLKKSGDWRIDGYKYQFDGEDKWNVGIL